MMLTRHHEGMKTRVFRRGGFANPPGQGIALSLHGLAPIQWRKISEKRYTELRRQVHEQARESA